MFEKLFKYPGVVSRHREAPCASERESYLAHRAKDGTSLATLRRFARELLAIVREMDLKPTTISADAIESAADRWAHRQKRHGRAGKLRWSRALFVQVAQDWLRFLGRLHEPQGKAVPYASLIQDFALFLRCERGLAECKCWIQRVHEKLVEEEGIQIGYCCDWPPFFVRPSASVSPRPPSDVLR